MDEIIPVTSPSTTQSALSGLHPDRIVIWDTHPVQYRAPLYAAIEQLIPGAFQVVYESDSSVRGYHDAQFGRSVAWDIPLLSGYACSVLPPRSGHGWVATFFIRFFEFGWVMAQRRPRASLHVQFDSPATAAAWVIAALLGVEQWLRVETQDEAFLRTARKACWRSMIWTALYGPFARAFYIGELNRRHLQCHGFPASALRPARYTVVEGVRNWTDAQKLAARAEIRARYAIPLGALVIGFCGKLIPKKDPELLMAARGLVESELKRPSHLLMVGSGGLETALREQGVADGDRVHFTGFLNQSSLPAYYLAMDVFVLPSRQEGETWGLVVNEALQAGCAVVMSSAVGSAADFGTWDRCRVFPVGAVAACAARISELAGKPRDFNWCEDSLQPYTLPAVAAALAAGLESPRASVL